MAEVFEHGHEDLVQFGGRLDRLDESVELGGHHKDGSVLPSPKSSVAADEGLEGAALQRLGVHDAVDVEVGCPGALDGSAESARSILAVRRHRVGPGDGSIVEPDLSVTSDRQRPPVGQARDEPDTGVRDQARDQSRPPCVDLLT